MNKQWHALPIDVLQLIEELQIVTCVINDTTIAITKKEKHFYAFAHKCPHAGFELEQGYITTNGFVVCPLHNYKFKLTNGLDPSNDACRLKVYKTKWDEVWLVEI